ncbi:MAG: hypothetical protein K5864_01100 [Bacteroidales bacterium]|nr:hypothetical protein [Bacteroidales bacterium]
MSNFLMYGELATQNGWESYHELNAARIDQELKDEAHPGGNKSIEPKVSIPSPFARFELVQKAFANVANPRAERDLRDLILVSHSLDLFQFYFESAFSGDRNFRVIRWDRHAMVEELKNGIDAHKLYGKALELYLRQEHYGFDKNEAIFILTYMNEPMGCTSPTSFFLATPSYTKFQDLMIEGEIPMFSKRRSLAERDENFIKYVYRQTSYIIRENEEQLQGFQRYLESQLEAIASTNKQLYAEINALTYRPYSDDMMREDYEEYDNDKLIQLYGRVIYRRKEGAGPIEESDFIINSEKSNKMPLVLTNNQRYDGWKYSSGNVKYDHNRHAIDYSDLRQNETHTILPGTIVDYPDGWLCEMDFLSDVLVQLPYNIDKAHFFSPETKNSYLLPIRPNYFEYFDIESLYDPNGSKDKDGSQPRIKFEEQGRNFVETVVVTLSIPVKGGKSVKLVRKYRAQTDTETNDEILRSAGSSECREAVGRIVACPVAVNIFPFMRLRDNSNHYNLEVLNNIPNPFRVEISAMNSRGDQLEWERDFERTRGNSFYYSLDNSFDYLRMKVTNGTQTHDAVLIPKWIYPEEGGMGYRFAFDFGTTNSYVSISEVGSQERKELKLKKSIVSTIDENDTTNDPDVALMKAWMKQEFLPYEIGGTYRFPLRTVVLMNKALNNNNLPNALMQVNIPFIYGREDCGSDNMIAANLKWSDDPSAQNWAKAFIKELVLLARAYVLEQEGNLRNSSFVWTYPLSMRQSDVEEFDEEWRKYYTKYFHHEENVRRMTESVAPLLYYRDMKRDLNDMGISIDIGGGTCDVVIKRNNDDIKFTSFRFAADVIFGAGFANTNPIVQRYYKKFSSMFQEQYRPVVKMIDNVCQGDRPATEANSILFALEDNPMLAKVEAELKSYNHMLRKDKDVHIYFMYFYAAIIFYLIRLMKDYGYEKKPERIMFSGTGSKMLNVIGQDGILARYTTDLIEQFSDGTYKYDHPIEIIIERKEPKQITAKGALHEPLPNDNADVAVRYANVNNVNRDTIRYSLVKESGAPKSLKYRDISDITVKEEVCNVVEDFNKRFMECVAKLDFENEYRCSTDSISYFKERIQQENLMSLLDTEIDNLNRADLIKENRQDRDFEGSLFFYPLKLMIQRMITNWKYQG